MLPFVQIPPLDLGFAKVYPFAVLVAAGVVAGHRWAVGESVRRGLEPVTVAAMGLCMVSSAFACSWLFRMAYQPGWPRGITSFGGIFGGLLGAWLFRRRAWTWNPFLRHLDLFACALAIGLIFGRAGCSIAHDHLGLRTSVWAAVDSPGGGRYDLGLIEFAFLLVFTPALMRVSRQVHPPGRIVGMFLTSYGTFRLLLDLLHDQPPHWLTWPVDRWFGSLIAVAGGALLSYGFRWSGVGARVR